MWQGAIQSGGKQCEDLGYQKGKFKVPPTKLINCAVHYNKQPPPTPPPSPARAKQTPIATFYSRLPRQTATNNVLQVRLSY